MALLLGKHIVIDFPIYGTNNRSLKHQFLKAATGGVIANDASKMVVVRALDDISFEFHEGDRVGLVGHNGSGKSTLLKVLAGIYEPSRGSFQVKGRITSMLSLFLGMDMEATGLENIKLRSCIMGVSAAGLKKIIQDVEDFSGVGEFLDLPMRTYSSGMLMRLAFTIATSVEADIILMDEWLSVGDSDFMEKAKNRLEHFINNARIVVLASHDYDLIKKQCNKIIHLEHGRLISQEMP